MVEEEGGAVGSSELRRSSTARGGWQENSASAGESGRTTGEYAAEFNVGWEGRLAEVVSTWTVSQKEWERGFVRVPEGGESCACRGGAFA